MPCHASAFGVKAYRIFGTQASTVLDGTMMVELVASKLGLLRPNCGLCRVGLFCLFIPKL